MSEYKTIFGKAVKALASDPTDAGAEGQIWYNTTTGSFRTILNLASWASVPAVSTERAYMQVTGGPTDSSLFFGGYYSGDSPPNTGSTRTEEWNGSTWTAGGTSNTTRYIQGGAITSETAGLMFGGYDGPPGGTNATESYNGSTWTTVNSLPNSPAANLGGGVATSAISAGGNNGATFYTSSHEWDGTNWTAGGTIPGAKREGSLVSTGVPNALAFGGNSAPTNPNFSDTTISYNGTSWSAENALPQATNQIGGAGPGTDAAIGFGGQSIPGTYLGTTHTWDGTNWTTSSASLGTARKSGGNGGNTGSGALMISGNTGSGTYTTGVEEYSRSIYTPVAATWASGGNLTTARRIPGSAGIVTAGLAIGGRLAPLASTNATEEYDGTSWGPGGNLSTARFGARGAGTQTAALGFGGATPATGATEEYDGTTWTAGGTLGTARYEHGGFGTQTAAVAATGSSFPAVPNATEEYNGTSWTAGNNVGTARYGLAAAGILTAGLIFGGQVPATGATEEYDGTNWTAGGSLNTARANLGGAGTQDAALAFGAPNATESYNGSAWSTLPATLGTPRLAIGGLGTQTSALAFGGSPALATTEEFTGETQALDYKTITTS